MVHLLLAIIYLAFISLGRMHCWEQRGRPCIRSLMYRYPMQELFR